MSPRSRSRQTSPFFLSGPLFKSVSKFDLIQINHFNPLFNYSDPLLNYSGPYLKSLFFSFLKFQFLFPYCIAFLEHVWPPPFSHSKPISSPKLFSSSFFLTKTLFGPPLASLICNQAYGEPISIFNFQTNFTSAIVKTIIIL